MEALALDNSNDARRTAARDLRGEIRAGRHDAVTTGLAPGIVQGNLVVLPAEWADDFERYCELNPKPCPLIAKTAPGDPAVPALGSDIDLRRDLPRYLVFEDGALAAEETDIFRRWRDDLVGFVLGCSYSFEEALLAAGLPLRHQELGVKASIYISDIATVKVGPIEGPMVVSIRPYTPADAERASKVTARFQMTHGAPVHIGDPAAIGIDDIAAPYSGPPPVIREGEVPVFWACGVTPQIVVEHARPTLCITHKPGHMLITDMLSEEIAAA